MGPKRRAPEGTERESGGPFKKKAESRELDRERCKERRRKCILLMEELRTMLAPSDTDRKMSQNVLLFMAAEYVAGKGGAQSAAAPTDIPEEGRQIALQGIDAVGILADEIGQILFALPSAGRLIGIPDHDLKGQSVLAIVEHSDRPRFRAAMTELMGSVSAQRQWWMGRDRVKLSLRLVHRAQAQDPISTEIAERSPTASTNTGPAAVYRPHTCTLRRIKSPGGKRMMLLLAYPDDLNVQAIPHSICERVGRCGGDGGPAVAYDNYGLHTMDGMWIHLAAGNTNGDNLGYAPNAYMSRTIYDFMAPADVEAVAPLHLLCVSQKAVVRIFARMRTSHGRFATVIATSRLGVNRRTGEATHILSHAHHADVVGTNELQPLVQDYRIQGHEVVEYDEVNELYTMIEKLALERRVEYQARREVAWKAEEQLILKELSDWKASTHGFPNRKSENPENLRTPRSVQSERGSDGATTPLVTATEAMHLGGALFSNPISPNPAAPNHNYTSNGNFGDSVRLDPPLVATAARHNIAIDVSPFSLSLGSPAAAETTPAPARAVASSVAMGPPFENSSRRDIVPHGAASRLPSNLSAFSTTPGDGGGFSSPPTTQTFATDTALLGAFANFARTPGRSVESISRTSSDRSHENRAGAGFAPTSTTTDRIEEWLHSLDETDPVYGAGEGEHIPLDLTDPVNPRFSLGEGHGSIEAFLNQVLSDPLSLDISVVAQSPPVGM